MWHLQKKILLILTEFPPDIGGMQTHALLLSRFLWDNEYDLKVFTYRCRWQKEQCAEVDHSFPFPVHRHLSRISYYYNLRVLSQEIKKWQPDLIYASTVFYGSLSLLHQIPVVCRSVGNDIMRPWIVYPYQFMSFFAANAALERMLYNFFRKLPRPEWAEILLRKKRLALTIENARASNVILANSHFTASLLTANNIEKEKIKIVVGGVDYSFFQCPASFDAKQKRNFLDYYRISEDSTVVMTACRLVDKKGIDFLLEAWHRIYYQVSANQKNKLPPNVHLLIIGDGRRYKKFIKLRDALGLQQRVTFTGSVAYHEMPKFYWVSDIFVLASTVFFDQKTGLADAETMGRVLCEANAAGVPVIASRSGGIPSVIQHNHNGLLFKENDFASFLRTLQKMQDVKLREKCILNGINRARDKFDWTHILNQHEKFFHHELKKNRNL